MVYIYIYIYDRYQHTLQTEGAPSLLAFHLAEALNVGRSSSKRRELARVELPGVVRCVEWAGAGTARCGGDVA